MEYEIIRLKWYGKKSIASFEIVDKDSSRNAIGSV